MTATDTIIADPDAERAASQVRLAAAEKAGKTQQSFWRDEARIPHTVSSRPGDGVNRFLLCTLVSKSAKQIKARAESAGERLPMAAIIKRVLYSYKEAAKEHPLLLSGPAINMASLRKLIDEIMREEIKRHAQEIIKNSQARLVQANRLGDEARIKSETEALERSLESRNRLSREFERGPI